MFRTAPTGIDRVEFEYARQLLDGAATDQTIGVITTPLFTGALSPSRARDIVSRVARAWRLEHDQQADRVLENVVTWLGTPLTHAVKQPNRFRNDTGRFKAFKAAAFFPVSDIVQSTRRLDHWASRHRAEPSMYFHCSHAQLNNKASFEWLERNDVPSAFFIHDAIPFEYPEFCSPGSSSRHIARLRTVSELASVIIVNSRDTARAVRNLLTLERCAIPDIEIVPLGISECFSSPVRSKALQDVAPYFVYVGTIEPRKNLQFLLAVWRRLVESMGLSAPRLIIAGRRGWENENVLDILERSSVLAPFIAEVSDLTDAGLAALVGGATALVAPSFAEGFGLPIAESLALGTPVLASDIAAHHEVGAEFATYIDPIDGPSWCRAIRALVDSRADGSLACKRISGYRPMAWSAHVAAAIDIFARASRNPKPRST